MVLCLGNGIAFCYQVFGNKADFSSVFQYLVSVLETGFLLLMLAYFRAKDGPPPASVVMCEDSVKAPLLVNDTQDQR